MQVLANLAIVLIIPAGGREGKEDVIAVMAPYIPVSVGQKTFSFYKPNSCCCRNSLRPRGEGKRLMPPPPRKGLRFSPPFLFPLPEKAGPSRSARHCCPSACPVILTAKVVEAGEIHDLSPKSHGAAGPPGPSPAASGGGQGDGSLTESSSAAAAAMAAARRMRGGIGQGLAPAGRTSFRCARGRNAA